LFRNRIIGYALLIGLICAVGFGLLYSIGNDTGLADYEANQPTISLREVSEDTPDEIAAELIRRWLEHFKTGEVGWSSRIVDYEIHDVGVRTQYANSPEYQGMLVASASFSVKPTRWNYDNWVPGNGVAEGDWVKHKFLFFAINREGDSYRLHVIGSAP